MPVERTEVERIVEQMLTNRFGLINYNRIAGAPDANGGGAPDAHADTHEPGGTDPMDVDAVAGTGSLRTIGTGSLQAAAGDHGHATLPSSGEKDALAGTSGTPSDTNRYVTDQDARLGGAVGAIAARVSRVNQTISDEVLTAIEFDTEEFDTDGLFTLVSDTRLTPQTAGVYTITGHARWASAGGTRFWGIRKNGTEFLTSVRTPGISSAIWSMPVAAIEDFNGTTDYIELLVEQNTTGNLSMDEAHLSMVLGGTL